MSNYIALTKILLKNSFSASFSGKSKGKINGRIKNIALLVLIGISMIPIIGGIAAVVWSSYGIFKSIGQEGLILGSGLLSVCMIVLFFGIFYIMNVFYFSKDVESLLPLPLRPSTIMAAKFTVTLFYEYLTELVILAPILISFGLVSKAGIVYYLYAVLAFLTLPIIPLVYSGILNIILMRITNISKHRDKLRNIGGIVGMFLAIFVNMKIQTSFSNGSASEQLKNLLMSGNNSLLNTMTGIFPTNRFLTLALINSNSLKGAVNVLLYIAISALLIALFLSLGESLYFKGLVGISESKSKRKKLTSEELSRTSVKSSVVRAYTMKELKLLVRTPVYFINCVLMNFIWPVVLLVPMFANLGEAGELEQFKEIVRAGSYNGLVLAIAFAAILFASGTNGVTSTAISREGTNIFINKFIPVSYTEQLMGKIMAGVILGFAALLSMLVAAAVAFAIPLHLMLLIALTGLLAVFFTSFIGILIDLNYPKLYWDNEQKAVKQNMNVMVSILISVVSAAIVIVPAAVLKLDVWVVFGLLVLLFGFANIVLYGLIKSAGESLFDKIEI
jgi:ABC-2 type transport system permease protein